MRRVLRAVSIVSAATLAAGLAAGCTDTRPLPAGTGLAVHLDREVGPRTSSPGDRLEGRLVADLAAGDRVVLAQGTVLIGRVTAVQERDERRPWAISATFDSVRIADRTLALPTEITGVEARVPEGEGTGSEGEGGSGASGADALAGEVVGARAGAALLRRSLIQAPGEAIVLGTGSEPAVLPEGSRVELRVSRRVEVPPPPGE